MHVYNYVIFNTEIWEVKSQLLIINKIINY